MVEDLKKAQQKKKLEAIEVAGYELARDSQGWGLFFFGTPVGSARYASKDAAIEPSYNLMLKIDGKDAA